MQAQLIGTDKEVFTYLFPFYKWAISNILKKEVKQNKQPLIDALNKAIEQSPKFRDPDTQRVYRQVFLEDFQKTFLRIFVQLREKEKGLTSQLPASISVPTPPPTPLPAPNHKLKDYTELFINEDDETVQEYIRRIVYELKRLNWYTPELLALLQNEAYCKRTFEIGYPLLNQTRERTEPNGTYRYYVNPIEILGKNYYVCSQWWVNYHEFVPLLNQWMKELIQKNTNETVKPSTAKPTDYKHPIFSTPVFASNASAASAPTHEKKEYVPQVVRVSLSSYVTVQYVDSGDEDSFLIMSESHIIAGDSGSHIISENSPLGEALMGGREGCLATVYPHTIDNKPNPPYQVRILRIEKWKN